MKFAEFIAALSTARETLQTFEGEDNWPGLGKHDRVYALPVDWQNEAYTAIVRASALHDHESCPIVIDVWHWHYRGGQEAPVEKLNPDQLLKLSKIKRDVRSWIDGELDELPPSTCTHIAHPERKRKS